MIIGEFDRNGWPRVKCDIAFPRLGLHGEVSFLVDTGAHRTALQPTDARNMSIPFDLLGNAEESLGIGGGASYFQEIAYLAFDDGLYKRIYIVNLLIAEPRDQNAAAIPSLLGRDIINYWDMRYAPMNGVLEFDALSADYTLEEG